MNLTRLMPSLDVARMAQSSVALIGAGGSADLAVHLVRCGLGRLFVVDPDVVDETNLARQGHRWPHLGRPKAEALADVLREVNTDMRVETAVRDCTTFTDHEVSQHFAEVDLLILATDSFAAQSWGNTIALRLGVPAVWIGLYAGGLGGEVAFWHPGLRSCFRCLTASRYAAHDQARREGVRLDPPSDGVSSLDTSFVDAVAGHVALGLLTRGAENRFGTLIERLGSRNFLLVKIDPSHATNGRDTVRRHLGVSDETQAFFGWTVAALSDPTCGNPPCPDCVAHRPEQMYRSLQSAE